MVKYLILHCKIFNFTLYILPAEDGLYPKNVMETNVYESESYSE